MSIQISNKLRIIADQWVMIPGCEPTSMVTSTGLLQTYSKNCTSSYVSTTNALAAISGSYIEISPQGDKYFVIPTFKNIGCTSCDAKPDYYALLRSVAEDPGDEIKSIYEMDYENMLDTIVEEYPGLCW